MQIQQRSSIEAGKALCYDENLMEIYEILAEKFMRQINGDGETKGWRELIVQLFSRATLYVMTLKIIQRVLCKIKILYSTKE